MHKLLLSAVIASFSLLSPSNSLADEFSKTLVSSALKRINQTTLYDASYVKLSYPMGDVANDRGVCTDVVIRAFRGAGVDLQKQVHLDMKKHFAKYPKRWGAKSTDKNIDHRRVPNLRVFFKRHGQSLKVTDNPKDYRAGDLVTWDLKGKRCCGFAQLAHIGLVTDKRSADKKRPLIVHNIGGGTQLQDMLFTYTITGHYRYKK